ncbi:MAG TPA: hypothetical protein VIG71_10700 [Enteractinococcus sp.]
MTDLQNLLEEIQTLDEATTPAPWQITETDDCDGLQIAHVRQLGKSLAIAEHRVVYVDEEDADAEFIALARTALPTLAKALQAVLAKCASMERGVGYRVSGKHDTWDSYHEGMSDMAGYIEETITDALEDDDAENRK